MFFTFNTLCDFLIIESTGFVKEFLEVVDLGVDSVYVLPRGVAIPALGECIEAFTFGNTTFVLILLYNCGNCYSICNLLSHSLYSAFG